MVAPDPDPTIESERSKTTPRPDFSAPLPRKALPKTLTDTLNDDDKWSSLLVQGKASSTTDSNLRYAAYASRLRTILLSAHRYVAYTSDIGESFRPVAHPNWVRAAYGVSWAYLVGDVGNEGYKAYVRNQATLHPADATATGASEGAALGDGGQGKLLSPQSVVQQHAGRVAPIDHWSTVVAQRAIFQGLASMGLPAFTIHSIVRYSGQALKNAKNTRIRTWAPIGLGLAAVPALPYMFDHPVEVATEWIFHKAFEMVGGPEAVGHRSAEETVGKGLGKTKEGTVKEKEL
ncbi:hypothetical protein LTR08_002704 [Meristemomyces frigidus]|nr:hypothetical protein LTR08_002704 [Meristemomyces frigidus]